MRRWLPRCKASCFRNGRGHEGPHVCERGKSLVLLLSSVELFSLHCAAVQFVCRFHICFLPPLLPRECGECIRIGEADALVFFCSYVAVERILVTLDDKLICSLRGNDCKHVVVVVDVQCSV